MRAWLVSFAAIAALAIGQSAAAQEQMTDVEAPMAEEGVTTIPLSFFRQFRPQNALEMVGRIPGFTYDDGENGSTLPSQAGNVLIDTERPNVDGRDLSNELRAIPFASVERIEVIRNGGRGVNMYQWPVLVNVIVRKAGTFNGTVSLNVTQSEQDRYGAFGNLSLQRREENSTIDIGFGMGRSPSGGAPSRTERRDVDDGTLTYFRESFGGGMNDQFSARGGFDRDLPVGRFRLNGAISWSGGTSRRIETNFLTDVTDISDTSERSSRNRNLSFSYNRDIGEHIEVEARLAHQDNLSSSTRRSVGSSSVLVFDSDRNSGNRDARLVGRYDRWSGLRLEGGIDTEEIWQGGVNRTFIDNRLIGLPSASTDAERLRAQLFTDFTWEARENITIEGGVRYDSTTITINDADDETESDEGTYALVRPNLEATYRFTPLTEVSVRIDRGVSPINIGNFISTLQRNNDEDEDTIIAGNTDIVPETDWSFSAQFQHRWGRRGRFSVDLEHVQEIDILDRVLLQRTIIIEADPDDPDSMDQVITDFFEAPGNIGDGFRRELSVNLALPLDRWGIEEGLIRMSANWRESNLTDSFTGEDRRFSGETPFSWNFGISKEFNNGALRTGLDASGGQSSVSFSRDEISISSRETFYSAYAEYRVTPDLTIRFEARDLIGRESLTFSQNFDDGDRVGGVVETLERRISEGEPTFELNLRRTF
jgi:hypothetical protein